MKFSKNQWMSIVSIAAVIFVGFLGYTNSTKVNVKGDGKATAVGPNAQATINNEFPKPTIEYTTSSSATIESDGYIHQVYNLRLYHVLGTAPKRTFNISNIFINCSEPEGLANPGIDNGRYYETLTIECWMRDVPSPRELLFWYSG